MAVTYTKPQQVDVMTIRMEFTSTATTPVNFRVFREGRKVAEFDSPDGTGDVLFLIPPGDDPFIEVLDDSTASPSRAYPGRITFHWQAVPNAVKYKVEESISAAWTERQVLDDTGRGSYTFESRWLEDAASHSFRVTAIDVASQESTPVAISFDMVRHPDMPDVSYVYASGTQKVTISAA